MISLTIDGKTVEVPVGTTVLQAAARAGITIPTLCNHPALPPYGGCCLCVVEVKGARFPQAACQLPAAPGMEITTESRLLTRSRKAILSLILSTYRDAAYRTTQKETQFEHWLHHYGLGLRKGMAAQPRVPVDADPNPFLWIDMNKCILCTRCIRACAEVQGRFVWNLAERGYDARVVVIEPISTMG